MGKNNRRNARKDRYQHEDLQTKFFGNKSNKQQTAGQYNNRPAPAKQSRREEEPVPELAKSAQFVLELISYQLENFMNVKDALDSYSVTGRRKIENALFTLDTWPTTTNTDEDAKIYLLNRVVKTDRETHALVRASMLVMIQVDGVPKYVIDTYLTKNYTGTATVYQMGDKGPVRKWSKIFNIIDGVLNLNP